MKGIATDAGTCQAHPCDLLRHPFQPLWLKICLVLPLAIALGVTAACTRDSSSNSDSVTTKTESVALAASPPQAASDNAALPHIDAKRAFEYTREVTAFGPRHIGSENHKKLEHYIIDHLKGDEVEDDAFTADTVEGNFPIPNIISKFP